MNLATLIPPTGSAEKKETFDSADFIQTVESCSCPQCENEIPRTHVVSKMDLFDPSDNKQVVRALCTHCKSAWKLKRVIRGGQWVPSGDVERITDPLEYTTLSAVIDDKIGVIRRETSSRRKPPASAPLDPAKPESVSADTRPPIDELLQQMCETDSHDTKACPKCKSGKQTK